MKSLKAILILFIFICFSCNNIKQQYSDGIEDNIITDDVILKVEETAPYKFSKVIAYNFRDNNHLDSLYLSAQVEVDSLNRPLWDDAQNWSVILKSKDSIIELYNKIIQLGKLEVAFDTLTKHIYIIEKGPYQKGLYKIEPLNNLNISTIDTLPKTRQSIILSLK